MANWEEIRKEWETTKITLALLAEKHDVKLGTLKSRKSREGWSRDSAKKDATKTKKVATMKRKDATPKRQKHQQKRSGNPHPENQFPKRNSAAQKHGFFAKFLPEETLEIMNNMNELSAADLIWQQIQIQYAAIIRAQKIMWVEDSDDMAKEKSQVGWGDSGADRYDIQFAWDRQATFLNAQSRAMGELRSLIKQFDELAHIHDERRLKLEQMQVGIDKTKAELDKISNSDDDKPIEVIIKRKGASP